MPRSPAAAKSRHRYVVATPRLLRGKQPTAMQLLKQADGIEIAGSTNPNRIIVHADLNSITKLKTRFREKLIIEPEITHFSEE